MAILNLFSAILLLVDVSDLFFCSGRGRGVGGAGGGGGIFYRKSQEGVPPWRVGARGEGPRGCLRGIWGGGGNIFCSGRNSRQVLYCASTHFCASGSGNSVDSRPAVPGIVRQIPWNS